MPFHEDGCRIDPEQTRRLREILGMPVELERSVLEDMRRAELEALRQRMPIKTGRMPGELSEYAKALLRDACE
jgi:hypothetical protein